jgi:hypothetical protein
MWAGTLVRLLLVLEEKTLFVKIECLITLVIRSYFVILYPLVADLRFCDN